MIINMSKNRFEKIFIFFSKMLYILIKSIDFFMVSFVYKTLDSIHGLITNLI